MLSKLILILLQVVAAWAVGPLIRGLIPVSGSADLFVYAIVFSVIVFLVGVLGGLVLKDVGSPSPATLTMTLIVALIAAAFVMFAPQIIPDLPNTTISNRGMVLAGAILGYLIKR